MDAMMKDPQVMARLNKMCGHMVDEQTSKDMLRKELEVSIQLTLALVEKFDSLDFNHRIRE